MKHLSNEDALLQEHEEFMRQVSESGVPLWVLQYYGEPNVKPKTKSTLMLTIKKIWRALLISMIPPLLYEVGVITFYCYMIGTTGWIHIHEVAWSQDLAMAIPFISFIMFIYQMVDKEEESRIDVPRYERPKYEKYNRRYPDDDIFGI